MPRYYFHVDSDSIHDNEGVDLEDLSAARNHSFWLMQTAIDEFGDAGAHARQWTITIADQVGKRLLRVELSLKPMDEQAGAKATN